MNRLRTLCGVGIFALALSGSGWITLAARSQSVTAAQHSGPARRTGNFLGVRIFTNAGTEKLSWQVGLPASCTECKIILTPSSSGTGKDGFFFHLCAPRKLAAIEGVHVKVDPALVRRVLVGLTHEDGESPGASIRGPVFVPFRSVGDGITFDVPSSPAGMKLPAYDNADVTQFYTYINTPGVVLRVSHSDPERRRGDYASGRWPEIELQAALNLEFAAREAIVTLGLDRIVLKEGASGIHLLNFDTYGPTVGPDSTHTDWPPHWHMIVLWKTPPQVHKAVHIYIASTGLLDHIDDGTRFPRGVPEETTTPDGRLMYSQTITREGYFVITSSSGTCRFTPIRAGFESGVNLACGERSRSRRIRAEDDLNRGLLTLYVDDEAIAQYEYDRDTGWRKPPRLIQYSHGEGKERRVVGVQ
jgi:hypothetical protein